MTIFSLSRGGANKKDKTEISLKRMLPMLGFGTADLDGDIKKIVLKAIQSGYRLIDTAAVYGSEEGIGQAIREATSSGLIRREDLIIQTKLAPDNHGYYKTLKGLEESLNRLCLDYIDVYFIHWPVSRGDEETYREKNIGTWQAFSELKSKHRIRYVGVCNFLERHLLQLIDTGYGCPEIHQLELHPGYQQRGLVRFCQERGMVIEAWSPMGRGILDSPKFIDMAAKYGKDIGQLALRFSIQKGFIPLTRSSNLNRIAGNMNIFDFDIQREDMEELDMLNSNNGYMDIWSYKRQQMY